MWNERLSGFNHHAQIGHLISLIQWSWNGNQKDIRRARGGLRFQVSFYRCFIHDGLQLLFFDVQDAIIDGSYYIIVDIHTDNRVSGPSQE